MKKINFLAGLIVCILFFTACQKQETNCRDGVLGSYAGTLTDLSGNTLSIKTIINADNAEKDVLISVESPTNSFPRTTFSGNLNIDCTVITVPSQAISSTTTASGNFFVDGTTIDGTLQGDTYAKINGSK